ncbi:MAG: 3-oxoacyl-ACP synthase III family protein [Bacteroidota bacterium]|nr:3-oxoacyl-ACP synthase III family protein [Bacteroidota bacterium]
MTKIISSIITGTGSYIPKQIFKNEEFKNHKFFNSNGDRINKTNEEIISKFHKITGIEERRYLDDEFVTSDMAYFAAQKAIDSAKIDKEDLDYIIVAHNFGDVKKDNPKTDIVPSLAARVKLNLAIKNPYTIAYDLPFGCPGWLQALIQAEYYIKSGDAKKIMIIGAETLSRVSDPHDIDSMIYSDGAGATIIEARQTNNKEGVISHTSRSDTIEHAKLLWMDKSYNPNFKSDQLFLKMNGRKLYEYALNTVPFEVKRCIDKAGLDISDIKKVLIHQANAKMDEAIGKRLYKLYNKEVPELIMPMTIAKLGNNSVATLPILYDKLLKREIKNHDINKGDYFVFASVGAGMNVNAAVYKM